MKPINIKESNLNRIIAFMEGKEIENNIQFKALDKLIQKRGEPIQSDDLKLNGVKCILLPTNQYFAMVHEPIGENFYPCITQTYILEKSV